MALRPPSRRLIVNADDFGRSASINQAVIRAHREGMLTSASLMVNEASSADAVALARALVETRGDRVLWGTDWPHPNHNHVPDDGLLVDILAQIAPSDAARRALLVDKDNAPQWQPATLDKGIGIAKYFQAPWSRSRDPLADL